MLQRTDFPLHLYQALEEEYVSLHGPIRADEKVVVHLPLDEKDEEGRPVTARRDWLFHAGHVKDPAAFLRNLLPAAEAEAAAPPPSRRDWRLLAEQLKDPAAFVRSLRSAGAAARARAGHPTAHDAQAFDWARENLKKHVLKKIDEKRIDEGKSARQLEGQDSEGGTGAQTNPPAAAVEPLEAKLNRLLEDEGLYDGDRFAKGWLGPGSSALVALHESGVVFRGEDLHHFNRLLLEDAFPESLEKIHNVRIAAIHQRLHSVKPTALCLSGGGIRSGTFALGLLQGMARHDLLAKFDYLSTVSGGGYIGGWLTAWLHRHPDGLRGVTRELSNSTPVSKIDPDPKPLQYLRNYSNFMTPKVGLLTADTWSFIGIYLRNLLLNWLVFVPLLVAALILPRVVLAITLAQSEQPTPHNLLGLGITFYGRYYFLVLGFALGVWALAYIGFNRPGVREMLRRRSRFWRERTDQRSFILYCLLPLLLASACLATYNAWSSEITYGQKDAWTFLKFGVVFTLAAWVIATAVLRRRWSEISLIEFGALLFAGAVGGLFFWMVSQLNRFGSPVVGYKNWRDTGQPFAWTNWAERNWFDWTTELYVCLAVPVFLLVFWLATTVFVGVSSFSRMIDDEDREWWARLGAWVLIAALAWAVFNTLVIFGPVALLSFPTLLTSIGGLSGLVAILLGRSSATAASEQSGDEKPKTKSAAAVGMLGRILPLLALVFLGSFLAAVSLVTTGVTRELARLANSLNYHDVVGDEFTYWLSNVPDREVPGSGFRSYVEYITPVVPPAPEPAGASPSSGDDDARPGVLSESRALSALKRLRSPEEADVFTGAKVVHMNVLHHTSLWLTLALGLLMLAFGILLARAINLNIFSLHGGYRNRLIRAFLGASRPPGERKPNPFTGFDSTDNIDMHELRPGLLDERDFLDPERLAKALRGGERNALSRHLSEKKRLKNVKDQRSTLASPALVEALRSDLNTVLEEERLFELDFAQRLPKTSRFARVRDALERAATGGQALDVDSLRGDYHILLNRLVLEEAYPGALRQGALPPPPYKLMHVVNTALNLVGGDNLAWQQRKAEPFSVTPLHSGCFRLGYRKSRDYGGRDGGGISMGTAATISGAAASSNMGYYTTSPVISLLLTLFNVRLGWWLGNPGTAGRDTYQLRSPKYSVAPVIYEAFGMTNDRNKYVYLTDGGHFENLALYEMVLRRCHVIVVSDGAQDEEYRFGDLGNAVRKIRIDLGVPIEFPYVPIYSAAAPAGEGRGMYWALGKIRYTCIDKGADARGNPVRDGVLLYIKPAVYGDEPRDVLEYKKSFPAFPHQSTGDQFFDEPQFESYRILGSHIMDQLCGDGTNELDLFNVIASAFKQLKEEKSVKVSPDFEAWVNGWLSRQE